MSFLTDKHVYYLQHALFGSQKRDRQLASVGGQTTCLFLMTNTFSLLRDKQPGHLCTCQQDTPVYTSCFIEIVRDFPDLQ